MPPPLPLDEILMQIQEWFGFEDIFTKILTGCISERPNNQFYVLKELLSTTVGSGGPVKQFSNRAKQAITRLYNTRMVAGNSMLLRMRICENQNCIGVAHYHAVVVTKRNNRAEVEILNSAPDPFVMKGKNFSAQESHKSLFTGLFGTHSVRGSVTHNMSEKNSTFCAIWSVFLLAHRLQCTFRQSERLPVRQPSIGDLFGFVRKILKNNDMATDFINASGYNKTQRGSIVSWIRRGGLTSRQFEAHERLMNDLCRRHLAAREPCADEKEGESEACEFRAWRPGCVERCYRKRRRRR